MLSHADLLANIRAIGRAVEATSADVFVELVAALSRHGLDRCVAGLPLLRGPLYAMSPLSFLARPQSWLSAIHRFHGTLSAAPNFAFELCLNKIEDSDLKGLDLGSLRFVGNGAEQVSIATLRRFIEHFAPYGFRPEAMAPVYGLAENAVAVTLPPPGRPPVIDQVDRAALTAHGMAEPARPDDSNAIEIVACGRPIPVTNPIIDEMGGELGSAGKVASNFGVIGDVGLFRERGGDPRVVPRWIARCRRSRLLAGGDLFVTGRIKDIVIRAGRQSSPHEIEEAVGAIPGLRKNGVAAFGVADPASGTERVVILAEVDGSNPLAEAALKVRAQEAATHVFGSPPDEVVLVQPGTVPKTASGKIRRAAARDLYLGKNLAVPQRALWWQLARLSFAGLGVRISQVLGTIGQVLYAAWWWTFIAAFFLLVGLP